jgi:hypothetical protein
MNRADQELDRLRDEERRRQFALRRQERMLVAEERGLARRLDAFRLEADRVAGLLAEDYRLQHWHKDPPPHPD